MRKKVTEVYWPGNCYKAISEAWWLQQTTTTTSKYFSTWVIKVSQNLLWDTSLSRASEMWVQVESLRCECKSSLLWVTSQVSSLWGVTAIQVSEASLSQVSEESLKSQVLSLWGANPSLKPPESLRSMSELSLWDVNVSCLESLSCECKSWGLKTSVSRVWIA